MVAKLPEYELSSESKRFLYREYWNLGHNAIATAINKRVSEALNTMNTVEIERLNAEIKYLRTLLDLQDNIEKKYNEFRAVDIDRRKHAAIINLKTAITPNGQLIAAILEEEGKLSFEALHNWCDEMRSLSDDELSDLLNSLVAEEVLSRQDELFYSLKNICDASLFKMYIPDGPTNYKYRNYMNVISANGGYIHKQDLQRKGVEYELLKPDDRKYQWDRQSELEEMFGKRFIKKEGDYYYLPMLGER